MRILRKLIGGNVLLKVTSMNAASVFTRVITGFLVSKALAYFVGASGIAMVGNLRNFLNSVQSLSLLGISNGLIKYTSEHKKDPEELKKVTSTAFFMVVAAALLIGAVVFFGANFWNRQIFPDSDYTGVIRSLGLAVPFYAGNLMLFAILNGHKKYKLYTTINIVGNVMGLVVSVLLMWRYDTVGALYALLLVPALMFFITLAFSFPKIKKSLHLVSFSNFETAYLKKFGSFSVMTLVSALLLPVVYIYVRNLVIETQNADAAGYWEAMLRISEYYLMFITTLMTLHVLPRFSEIHTDHEFRKEVFSFYKTILPLLGAGMIVIFFLRHFVIRFVFTEEFLPMQQLFGWQMAGDFLKMASVLLAYQFLAKKMFWHYMITEIGSIALFFVLSIYFVENYGFVGASIAHFWQYMVYFAVLLIIFRKKLFGRKISAQ